MYQNSREELRWGGVPVPLFPWNKLACSPVPKKSKICFLMLPVPKYCFVPLFPSKFGLCSPEINALFPLFPKTPGRVSSEYPHPLGLAHKVILYSSEFSQFPGKVCWLVQALEKSLGDSGQTRFQGVQLKYRPGVGGPIAFFKYKPKKLVIFQGGPAPTTLHIWIRDCQ